MTKDEATEQGNELRKELNRLFGKGWKVDVYEEGSGYCECRCRKGLISIDKVEYIKDEFAYTAYIHKSKEDAWEYQWQASAMTIQDALNKVYSRASTEVFSLLNLFEKEAEPTLRKAITQAGINGLEFAEIEETTELSKE
tara:strand:+ start:1223 stop:1642 length:420 start_codon:yes stop_codon:yes gene_type:complete